MSENMKPPHWAKRLLRTFANTSTLEEVEGDLDELFVIWVKAHGIRKAKWMYARTVMTVLRPFSTRKNIPNDNYPILFNAMIRSYFKMSWRTLLKNKVSAIINISGLTLGLSSSIIVMLVVMDEFNYDKFHEKLGDIYLLMKNQQTNDGISTGDATAGPTAEALRTDYAEVKHAARLANFNGVQVLINTKVSYESGAYADPSLFSIMTFPAVIGDPVQALQNNSVVLTKDMAKKLFGAENALGKTMMFDNRHALTIGAVIENIPQNSSVKFNMVLPFALFAKDNDWLKKWDDNRIMTWMQLQPSANIALLNSKMTNMLQQRSNDKTVSLFAYPLIDFHLRNSFSNGKPQGGQIMAVNILIAFGVFMLLIACINFMNIATAQSEYRAKEVGVRKVLGASRKLIVFQFLNESFIITFLSLFTAIGLALLIIPPFNTLVHSSIAFDFKSIPIWVSTILIAIITALVAGSYPSLFLSRFLPVKVLKGRTASMKGGGVRRALVTFQFLISGFFVIGTIIMNAQVKYVEDRPLGYAQENLVNIQLDSILSSKFAYLKNEVLKIPNVKGATGGAGNILYSGGSVTGMDWPGKRPGEELSIVVGDVGYDWTKTMDIKIIQGRDFDPARASDLSACMINESAVTKMGLENPIGSLVGGHEVIGVFKNYVFNNPFGEISPMSVYLNPAHMNHLYLRVQNNKQWRKAIDRVEKISKAISPDFPFQFSFTKDEYQHRFSEISDTSLMITGFGSMTVFISCLGLFGLAGFVAEKRSKEMSIRKVFGASVTRVLVSLSTDFIRPVVYALLLVVPISLYVAQQVLENLSYRVPLSWWMFASASMITLLIALSIILYHGWRTARENPVIRLRNE